MTAFLRSAFSILLAAAVIAFALANREPVFVILSPVHSPVEIPLFLLALSGAVIGFVAGGLMIWLNGSTIRQERRAQKKVLKTLEKKLADTEENHRASPSKTVMVVQD